MSVRIGIVGVGNCASSLVQGLVYYRVGNSTGLPNPVCAGFSIGDVVVSAAFDVHHAKIGRDLAEAIWTDPNNALCFVDVPPIGVIVKDGILADGIGANIAPYVEADGYSTVEAVVAHLRDSGTQVIVNLLPTGSQRASELYAEAALLAGCAFVNCMPATIARSDTWSSRYAAAGLPLIGDDLKSQFGATLIHRAVVDALEGNGVVIRKTQQLLSGGNMDFLNLQDPERFSSKQEAKQSGIGVEAHVGAEHVPFLRDRKLANIRVEALGFGGTAIELDLRLSVEDSPSAAGTLLDAVRYARFALDHQIGGVLDGVSALLMKAPPRQMPDPKSAVQQMLETTRTSS